METRARDALEFVGIADLALERAGVYSTVTPSVWKWRGPSRPEPELLLLDEPFGGLNPAETELIGNSIRRFVGAVRGSPL